MRWRQFCAELLAACDDLGGELVVTLGALLADTPHTRPIPVIGHRDRARPGRPAQARAVDVRRADRHRRGLPGRLRAARHPGGVVLGGGPPLRRAAAVPEGDAGPARPDRGAARGAAIPLGDLPEDARAWERGVDELAEEDEDVADYVRALEETRDTTDLPEASGEAIAREFERYLEAARPKRAEADSRRHGSHRAGRGRRRAGRARSRPRSGSLVSARPAVAEGGVRPGVDAPRARTARRGRRRARRARVDDRRGRSAGTDGERAAPAVELVDRRPQLVVGPLPVGAVVVAQQRSAGSPSGRRRCCAARRRRPGCPSTSTSSRRRRRPSRRARRPGRTARPVEHLGLGGAHLVVREDQVAAAALDVERARRGGRGRSRVHSTCQPGRPRPSGLSQAGSPGRSAAPDQAVERVLLARPVGVAAAVGEDREHLARGSSRTPRRTPGRRRPRSRGRRRPGRRAPASWSRWIRSTTSGIDSTAPTKCVGREDPQRRHVLTEQLGLALRPARASRPRPSRPARAAGRRRR